MSVDTLLTSSINWPLFILTSLIICLRTYAPTICLWFLNKFYSSSINIDKFTDELKQITYELGTISQLDEFAAYTRKDRKRNLLVQQIKDERNNIEIKQKNYLIYFRLILNITVVLIMILLAITGQRHQLKPLFNFPFFRFPLIIWLATLNTFITTISDIYLRYRTNKNNTE